MDRAIDDMTDEEIEAMPIPDFTKLVDTQTEEDAPDVEEDTDTSEDIPEVETTEESREADTEEAEGEEASAPEVEEDDEVDEPETEPVKEEPLNYEELYKKLLSPFKANGKEITPKSPEDLIRLAQMGANYHEKMAGMKPARKTLKKLENNDLLDDERIDLLIDAHKGNPEAITKLLKEHKIDPLDVDVEREVDYKPSNYSVSDAEIELDSVLESIKDSPKYNDTIEVVTNKWDDTSRERAATNPHIISIINEHMVSGVYDTVMNEVRYQRSLGKLQGVSDIDAYGQMGDRLEKEGTLTQDTVPQRKASTEKVIPKPDPIKESDRRAKKKAASPTKQSIGTSKLPKGFNPLDMSDEEFEKFDPKLIGIK